jgi:tetratricopeptide (TPR) repeat protein
MDPLQRASLERNAVETHPFQCEEVEQASERAFFATPSPLPDLQGGAVGVDKLPALARQGRWTEVAAAASLLLRSASSSSLVLQCVTYHALALAKQRLYSAASDVLASPLCLSALETERGRGGEAAVPFALRLLQADLPQRVPRGSASETQDALCLLLDSCVRQLRSEGSEEGRVLWHRRCSRVLALLVAFHAARRDWHAALSWLDWEARLVAAPPGSRVVDAAVQVLLQAGDAEAARALGATQREGHSGPADGDVSHAQQCFSAKDFDGARSAYGRALAASPGDPVCVNNAAVCALFSTQLPAAVELLERALKTHPRAMLHEPLIANLCSLYELSSADAAADKARLASWVAANACEDFDVVASLRP